MVQVEIKKTTTQGPVFFVKTNFGPALGSNLTGPDLGANQWSTSDFTSSRRETQNRAAVRITFVETRSISAGSRFKGPERPKCLHNMLNLDQLQNAQCVLFYGKTTTLHPWQ